MSSGHGPLRCTVHSIRLVKVSTNKYSVSKNAQLKIGPFNRRAKKNVWSDVDGNNTKYMIFIVVFKVSSDKNHRYFAIFAK
jgi:hypothetical protein